MAHLVLFNIGWMKHYRGQTDDDKIVNGGVYVQENEDGGEVWNFLPFKGRCHAYVRSNRGGELDIARVGAENASDHADGVTVVFTATRPSGGGVVVGWYKNARVWREARRMNSRGPRRGWQYLAEADEANCVLLAPDDRVFPVPRARKGVWGLGQSNVRYVDEPAADPFLGAVSKYMDSPMAVSIAATNKGGGTGRQVDPALRAKVEIAAVERVVEFYESKGFKCRSVEGDNTGWDLEAERGDVALLVEVKGCSGEDVAVELTPNEFAQMKKRRDVYRLAIVTNALTNQAARLSILAYNIADNSWRDEDGRAVHFKEIVAARVTLGELVRSAKSQRGSKMT